MSFTEPPTRDAAHPGPDHGHTDSSVHLAIAAEGTGWHPASWRRPKAQPGRVFTAEYWGKVAQQAEASLADFLTLEDALGLQPASLGDAEPGRATDRLRGRLDASLVAAWAATVTHHIGLVPTISTTHTEPFHVAKSVATLDYISEGRGGWRAQVSARPAEAAHFGRRSLNDPREDSDALTELFGEAEDVIDVARRLWDSWESDAEIRDADTGRFVDRDKLHYVDFTGRYFSVKGPSITPRPPQGHPIVAALAHQEIPYRLAARGADVVFVTPGDDEQAENILRQVRAIEAGVRALPQPLKVFADIEVVLSTDQISGPERLVELNRLAGTDYTSDALIFAGTATELAELIERWHRLGYAGVRLRPAEHRHDLPAIAELLVPELQRRGIYRTSQPKGSLRERLGLDEAANRYASAS